MFIIHVNPLAFLIRIHIRLEQLYRTHILSLRVNSNNIWVKQYQPCDITLHYNRLMIVISVCNAVCFGQYQSLISPLFCQPQHFFSAIFPAVSVVLCHQNYFLNQSCQKRNIKIQLNFKIVLTLDLKLKKNTSLNLCVKLLLPILF